MYDAPKGPSFRPNNPAQKEPINGKKINNKYIESFKVINFKTLHNTQKHLIINQYFLLLSISHLLFHPLILFTHLKN